MWRPQVPASVFLCMCVWVLERDNIAPKIILETNAYEVLTLQTLQWWQSTDKYGHKLSTCQLLDHDVSMNVMMHKGINGRRTAPSNHILPHYLWELSIAHTPASVHFVYCSGMYQLSISAKYTIKYSCLCCLEMPNTHFTKDYLLCFLRNTLQAFDHWTTGEKAAV